MTLDVKFRNAENEMMTSRVGLRDLSGAPEHLHAFDQARRERRREELKREKEKRERLDNVRGR